MASRTEGTLPSGYVDGQYTPPPLGFLSRIFSFSILPNSTPITDNLGRVTSKMASNPPEINSLYVPRPRFNLFCPSVHLPSLTESHNRSMLVSGHQYHNIHRQGGTDRD